MPIVKEWQEHSLEDVYAVVFLDAIHFHVRSEGRIVKQAVYITIGINMEGTKDVLGMYAGQNESAKFWLSILNGLKKSGCSGYSHSLCGRVERIYILNMKIDTFTSIMLFFSYVLILSMVLFIFGTLNKLDNF